MQRSVADQCADGEGDQKIENGTAPAALNGEKGERACVNY
jgi:hypothetical protein